MDYFTLDYSGFNSRKDISKRAEDISLALKAMDYYYSHYRNDGGCDEGPGYWASSCGCFFNCNYLLYKATDGKIDLRNEEKFHRMGEFICKVYMGRNNRFVNFADASPPYKSKSGNGIRIWQIHWQIIQ